MLKGAIKIGSLLIIYNLYYRRLKRWFVFNGKKYRYFYHPHNATWENERKIEIPIILDLLKQNQGKRILEVGRVLPHYFSIPHDVLDKYEKGKDVINEDMVSFTPSQKYDLIISISTLEHVGTKELPQQPEKVIQAVENLKKYLNPGGQIVFTVPIGENPYLDNLIRNKKINTDELYYFDGIIIGIIKKQK